MSLRTSSPSSRRVSDLAVFLAFAFLFAFHCRLCHAIVGRELLFAPIGLICQDPRLGYKTANGIAKTSSTSFLDRNLTITLRVRPLRRLRSLQAPLRRVR